VNIKINGVQVEDKIFNGLTLIDLDADLSSLGVTLLESSNQRRLIFRPIQPHLSIL